MVAYITETEAKARFGTSKPTELKGRKIASPHGEPWRIVKAEMLGNVDPVDHTFQIKLTLQ